MAMKHYPPEFKADAVALYRSRPGATIAHIAEANRHMIRDETRPQTPTELTLCQDPAYGIPG